MNRFGIPVVSLIAATIVGCLFFVPLPSWYNLVGFITSATVLTYIMGGIGLRVLRTTAPDLPRPFRLPFANAIAPLSFLAALMLVYWSGFTTLVNVFVAVFAGLAAFVWFYAPNEGWIRRATGGALGTVFLLAWIVVNRLGGWVLNTTGTAAPGALSFPAYFGLFAATLIAFSLALWWLSTPIGRQHIQPSAWLVCLLLATSLLSYYGEYGPLKPPALAFPQSDLLALVLGIGFYYWAVASGFATRGISDDHWCGAANGQS